MFSKNTYACKLVMNSQKIQSLQVLLQTSWKGLSLVRLAQGSQAKSSLPYKLGFALSQRPCEASYYASIQHR